MTEIVGAAPADDTLAARVDAVRRFNRFYTRAAGLLPSKLLRTTFSLTQARVLYELAQGADTTATALCSTLRLDGGYVSRMLAAFEARGLVERSPSDTDGRQRVLRLTTTGRKAFRALDERSAADVAATLQSLSPSDQRQLIAAMRTIETVLGDRHETTSAYLLRQPEPGDLGWVVQRHGAVYAQEYGWDERFEGLVARIVADFAAQRDLVRERCWIAERNGTNVGCVFLVRHPDLADVAKLRLLLVEAEARGLGIGKRLVEECTRFARQRGYRLITLWTNDVLHSARHIYEAVGYRLVHEEPHQSFGHDLVGQTWELTL